MASLPATSKSPSSAPAPKVSEATMLTAAFEILREDGLAGLSMRAVGRRLGVNASALYWHLRDRTALIEKMVGSLYDAALAATPADVAWQPWSLAFGHALRRVLLAVPDAAQLCGGLHAGDESVRDVTLRFVRPLRSGGLSEARALLLLSSLMSLVVGWVIYEQNGQLHRSLSQLFDFDAGFETGISALVRGFASETS